MNLESDACGPNIYSGVATGRGAGYVALMVVKAFLLPC